MNRCQWIIPEWPAPPNVKALTTLRSGAGHSLKPYDSFNLGAYAGEDPSIVLANRELLKTQANLPNEPLWLKQVHGTTVVEVNESIFSSTSKRNDLLMIEADASVAFQPNQICVVTTADCLPILLCNQSGICVSAIHAGWRGLAAGVIEAAFQRLNCEPANLLAWLGPAIGPTAFEVKEDVVLAFKEYVSDATFHPTDKKGVWLADLYQLAREQLHRLGIKAIFGGGFCTYQDSQRFYSFRRSNRTGRMATLIWMTALDF